ncbi:LysR substrate-binding domain-containing protein [Aestuariispira insulae]|uniref:LysR family glycine cleavage system transcriptional activator n=1 Tax=Aestuariispira insulae TaxID=1461337 RepID=A0A3D9HVI5_9PROT|nr:LysR substrate-binding domain-containing protein [Aestuariispira insulae]RED53439.1 LysR family glycine cleavage system transcriptional activator [Aestuariispira insulae]
MKNIPLNGLRAFAAIYETGGIRPAARSLSITHSSVSRHLRELEAWLGVTLVSHEGGRKNLSFTAQGEMLGRDSLKQLRALDSSCAAIREMTGSNTVTIATTPSFAARWLLPRLARFNEDHPAIEVSVIADQKIHHPNDARVDFNIRMGKGPWSGVNCLPLMDETLFPVAGREFFECHGPDIALADHTLLHDRDPQTSWQSWQSVFPQEIPNLGKGPRFASSDLLLRAAAQNLGIALARERLAEEDLAIGNLKRLYPEQKIHLARAYWIIQPEGGSPRGAVQVLINWLRQEARNKSLA